MNKLDITGENLLPAKQRFFILRIVRDLYNKVGLSLFYTGLHFVDQKTIKELNQRWRGQGKATDVLSFSAQQGYNMPGIDAILGDIVLSVPQAKAQSVALNITLREEISALFVHGLLHLLGFDHEISVDQAQKQLQLEMSFLDLADLDPHLAMLQRNIEVKK